MKKRKKLLGIFSRERSGIRPASRGVGIAGEDKLGRRMTEQFRDTHVELERKAAEKTRDLAALYALTGPISQASELTGVLGDAVLKIIDVTGADAASIRLSDERGDRLVLTAHHGFPEAYTREISRETSPGRIGRQILQTGEAIISEELTGDSRFHRGLLMRHGFRSAAYVLLKASQRKVLGIMVLASRKPGCVSSEQSALFAAIAGQIAIAIENSQFCEQLRNRVKELQRKTTELEKANNAKNEFLSVMSHELRTPLNVVLGYTRVVKERMLGDINPEQEKALEKAISNSGDLLNMVGGILEATSIEAGAVTVESCAMSPNDFLDSLRSNYDVPLEKEVALKWDYPSDLPHMQTDCEKLKHILQNLINNAIKFTDKGHVTISVRYLPEAAAIEFRVSDTGTGIPRESFSVIFEMFRQVDSFASRPFGGVGLGLFIVKKLTELLGGKIEVDSKVGEGSVFTVTIPLVLSLTAAHSGKTLVVGS